GGGGGGAVRAAGAGGGPESPNGDGFVGLDGGSGGRAAVGAPAAADSSAVGTDTGAAQYGHFTRLPADSSRARNRFPHDGQPSVIGMTVLRGPAQRARSRPDAPAWPAAYSE